MFREVAGDFHAQLERDWSDAEREYLYRGIIGVER